MEQPSRIQQVYGYAVCLVTIVTFLIGATNFVNAAFARVSPLRAAEARYGDMDGALSSFEAYQATAGRARVVQAGAPVKGAEGAASQADTMTTAEQRRRYEALRADRIDRMSFDSSVRLVEFGLLIVLSAGLFWWHWRWLHRREAAPA